MLRCGIDDREILLAVADPPIVLAPRHLIGIGIEVRAGDMMMNADLGAAQTAKEAFGLVSASFAVAVNKRVVDALHQ